MLADPDYRWHTGRELGGFRTILGVPMLADDRVAGVLTLWRVDVEPFGDRTIELLTTFAAQAAIAIRNVQLFQDLTRVRRTSCARSARSARPCRRASTSTRC